jgi:hypothetical protein
MKGCNICNMCHPLVLHFKAFFSRGVFLLGLYEAQLSEMRLRFACLYIVYDNKQPPHVYEFMFSEADQFSLQQKQTNSVS